MSILFASIFINVQHSAKDRYSEYGQHSISRCEGITGHSSLLVPADTRRMVHTSDLNQRSQRNNGTEYCLFKGVKNVFSILNNENF